MTHYGSSLRQAAAQQRRGRAPNATLPVGHCRLRLGAPGGHSNAASLRSGAQRVVRSGRTVAAADSSGSGAAPPRSRRKLKAHN